MNLNSSVSNSNPSFGRLYCVSGGKQFLEKTLNKIQRVELQELIDSQKDNPINVMIASHNDKRLAGWVVFQEKTNKNYYRKDYTQRILFDTPVKFIKRLCDKANILKEKYLDDIQELGGFQDFELKL